MIELFTKYNLTYNENSQSSYKIYNDLELFTEYLNPILRIWNEDYLPFSRIFIILQ